MPERGPYIEFGMPPRHLPSHKELVEIVRRSRFLMMAQHCDFRVEQGKLRGKAAVLASLLPDV